MNSHGEQLCFLKERSTEVAVLNMTENIKRNIENRLLTMEILIDLRKACDLVNHDRPLDKLHFYGFRGVPLELRAT